MTTTKPYNLLLVDREDVQAASAWARQRAAAALALQQALARQQQIESMLASDPAAGILSRLAAAQKDVAQKQAAATAAQAQADTAAAAAARFAANDLAAAQANLDAATKAVADALAQLLKNAHMSVALTATVDGLALRDRYLRATTAAPPIWDHATIPFRAQSGDPAVDPELNFPAVGEHNYTALLAVLDQLDQHVHAVADIVTVESVHQLVQGNVVRSGAALDLAASGHVPDEFAVVRTPQRGGTVTHRVLVLMDPVATPAWAAPSVGAAATADPFLNAWVSRLLPDPRSVHVTAHRLDPATGAPRESLDLTLDSLHLDPLEWVRLAPDPAELHQRVARVARSTWGSIDGRIVIDDTSQGALPSRITLADMVVAATSIHDLLLPSRALSGADVVAPSAAAPDPESGTVSAVVERVSAVSTLVENATNALASAAAGDNPAMLLDALFAASALGEGAATPQLMEGTPDVASLRAQAAAVIPRLRARTAGTPVVADPSDRIGTMTRAREQLATLCGVQLPILLPVALPANGRWEKDLAGQQITLAGAQPVNVRAWLQMHARVRPAIQGLLTVYDLSESLNSGAVLNVRATQLAADGTAPDTTWIGANPAPAGGTVNIVVQRSVGTVLPTSVTGLAVDAWTHVVPAPTIPTGVAFHYNQPDSTPPQAVLVAVAPNVDPARQPGSWDLDTLLDVLTSTLALARDRAVTPEQATVSGLTTPEAP